MSQWALLRLWRQRSAPRTRDLARALIAGLGASIAGTGLFVGAVTLLVFSAGQPSWQTIAVWLVALELVAFLRSPLRFAERLASHALGYAAVTTWRTWLMRTVGRWSSDRWRLAAAGDVLDRALSDTDELQDLWVRGLLPLAVVGLTMAVADALLFILASWALATVVVVLQLLATGALARGIRALGTVDIDLRRHRGALQAIIVSVSGAASELALLGAGGAVDEHLRDGVQALDAIERRRDRVRAALSFLTPVLVVAIVGVFAAFRPHVSPTLTVASLWLAVAISELGDSARQATEALVGVLASAERLSALETSLPATTPWPNATPAFALTYAGDTVVLEPGARIVISGPSGSGKTTLLEQMAALRDEPSPLTVNGVSLSLVDEHSLRQFVRFVPADPGLVRGVVRDTLFLGAAVSDEAYRYLAALNLPLAPDSRLEGLSRGERQRFALARALSTAPLVVILDEPTSGLGPDDTERVLRLLADQNVACVIASHDPQVVAWATTHLTLN